MPFTGPALLTRLADPCVTPAELADALRLDGAARRIDFLAGLIQRAETWAEGATSRIVIARSVEERWEFSPGSVISSLRLSYRDVRSVESVQSRKASEDPATLDDSEWSLVGSDVLLSDSAAGLSYGPWNIAWDPAISTLQYVATYTAGIAESFAEAQGIPDAEHHRAAIIAIASMMFEDPKLTPGEAGRSAGIGGMLAAAS